MTVSAQFVSQALEYLAAVAPITYRKVFSGVGLYHQDVLFGLLVEEGLYFRTDEFSRDLYQARKMQPFKPGAVGDIEPVFYRLPHDVLVDSAELKHWMRAAVEAGQVVPVRTPVEARPVVTDPMATGGQRALAG